MARSYILVQINFFLLTAQFGKHSRNDKQWGYCCEEDGRDVGSWEVIYFALYTSHPAWISRKAEKIVQISQSDRFSPPGASKPVFLSGWYMSHIVVWRAPYSCSLSLSFSLSCLFLSFPSFFLSFFSLLSPLSLFLSPSHSLSWIRNLTRSIPLSSVFLRIMHNRLFFVSSVFFYSLFISPSVFMIFFNSLPFIYYNFDKISTQR